MDLAGPLVEVVKGLWGLASKPFGYIYNLKDNVELLRRETDWLKATSEGLKERVEGAERGGGEQRSKLVQSWLVKVQEFASGVDQVLQEAEGRDQIKCLSRCLPQNCKSSYKLGKIVDQMLNDARELQTKEGKLGVLTVPLPSPSVLEMPMDETVGLDISKFKEVWKWLVDEKQVGMIGLYGSGGVGKTTLMKKIIEELSRANHGFDVIIWVVVSKQVNEDKIQDAIRKRLDIKAEPWKEWTSEEKVCHLKENLTRKKFMLLIDDLWGWLDLLKIGVPRPGPNNGSKVVFTTRSKQLCAQMRADKTFEVQRLTYEEALELFENNAGKSTIHSNQEILEFAKGIAGECKGLPLALITIGRAMAGKKNPRQWKHALTTLRNNPDKLPGMVEEVYQILEFSYNSLNDSSLQLCFLYCCLFPEDYIIRPHNLIGLWIGEGFLGDNDGVYSLTDKGECFLESLKMASLLESGHDYKGEYVKMHDVIRDMATWIARDHGQRENKLLVIEKEEDMSVKMISKWGKAEKISIWGKWIENINQIPPECSQLKTLFVKETNVKLVPRGFFDSMKACLTVLDLSDNRRIELFPEEICNLINLCYLNLSMTRISELPVKIKKLIHLQWLLLDETSFPFLIPTGAIASLPLNVFSYWSTSSQYTMAQQTPGQVKEEEIVEELGCMSNLIDLSIEVVNSSSALKIFQYPSLRRSIRRAVIRGCQDLTYIPISCSPTGSSGLSHLKELRIWTCAMLKEIKITQGVGRAPDCSCFPNLVKVSVGECGFLDLSWLVHVPKLQELTIRYLPNLTSICEQTLPFPQLKCLEIGECPRLRKLPLDSNSARGSLETVRVLADWWAKLEWEDDAACAHFTAKTVPLILRLRG